MLCDAGCCVMQAWISGGPDGDLLQCTTAPPLPTHILSKWRKHGEKIADTTALSWCAPRIQFGCVSEARSKSDLWIRRIIISNCEARVRIHEKQGSDPAGDWKWEQQPVTGAKFCLHKEKKSSWLPIDLLAFTEINDHSVSRNSRWTQQGGAGSNLCQWDRQLAERAGLQSTAPAPAAF